MTIQELLNQRLINEQLASQQCTTPHELVSWFGAVQAQDYSGARWALGQRLPKVTDEDIEKSYNEGSILRTHALRPTWHFVTPQDIRWIMQLNAPRVKKIMQYYNRQLDLTDEIFQKSQKIFLNVLKNQNALTRTELSVYLEKEHLPSKGQALGHIAMQAELDTLICSGPRRGKQFTYMLVAERAPQAAIMSYDEALAELTKRYFQSHGPATIKDFAWWSGLTTADIKKGIAMHQPKLKTIMIEGLSYWYFEPKEIKPVKDAAYLLPNYDEYTIAYKERDAFYDPSNARFFDSSENVAFGHMIVLHGKIVAMWKRTINDKSIDIQTLPFIKMNATEVGMIKEAFSKYERFYDKKINLLNTH